MAIKTVVTWVPPGPDGDVACAGRIFVESTRLTTLGVTDGLWENVGNVTFRYWTTVEAAQGWCDFLMAGHLKPVSAVVDLQEDPPA